MTTRDVLEIAVIDAVCRALPRLAKRIRQARERGAEKSAVVSNVTKSLQADPLARVCVLALVDRVWSES